MKTLLSHHKKTHSGAPLWAFMFVVQFNTIRTTFGVRLDPPPVLES